MKPAPFNVYLLTWRYRDEPKTIARESEVGGTSEQDARKRVERMFPQIVVVRLKMLRVFTKRKPAPDPPRRVPEPVFEGNLL